VRVLRERPDDAIAISIGGTNSVVSITCIAVSAPFDFFVADPADCGPLIAAISGPSLGEQYRSSLPVLT
jgi:hypothetical protein